MSFKQWRLSAFALFLILLALVDGGSGSVQASLGTDVGQPKSGAVEFITVEELKSKITNNERVIVIDVRSTSSYTASNEKIKGAIHVKLRRLKVRLAYPPFKNAARDAEIITYCACPSDESSVHAAQVLLDAGFKRVRVLKGGWQEWLTAGGQVESRPKGL